MPILSPDEISTIFVVGFPSDIREREFQNLFMFASGFEGASLKFPEASTPGDPSMSSAGESELLQDELQIGGMAASHRSATLPLFKQQTIGFARFQRRQDALLARDHLNGRSIDVERGSVLKVEMAKKNLFIAPRKQLGAVAMPRDEMERDEMPLPFVKTTRSLSLSIPGNPAPIDITMPNTVFAKDSDSETKPCLGSAVGRSFSVASASSPYVLGENPPCNTLYVGNLPLNADDDELRLLFLQCEGFKRLSFKTKPNGPMCFVEFEDVGCAREAMDSLYGTLLSSSTKGGIRLSFSKNPLGVRNTTSPILAPAAGSRQPCVLKPRTGFHMSDTGVDLFDCSDAAGLSQQLAAYQPF